LVTAHIDIVPHTAGFRRAVLDGLNARCRCAVVPIAPARPNQPGKLDEYPSRVEHARAHRRATELRRRDRRRKRTGREPIQPAAIRRYGPLLQQINSRSARREFDQIQDGLEELIGWRPAVTHVFALTPPDPEITHHDRYLGEGALDRDETSSVHSTDSSGTGGSWADFLARLDDVIGGE
jgi:hypothetical protein